MMWYLDHMGFHQLPKIETMVILQGFSKWTLIPVAQTVQHGTNNAKVMVLIPRESKNQ